MRAAIAERQAEASGPIARLSGATADSRARVGVDGPPAAAGRQRDGCDPGKPEQTHGA